MNPREMYCHRRTGVVRTPVVAVPSAPLLKYYNKYDADFPLLYPFVSSSELFN